MARYAQQNGLWKHRHHQDKNDEEKDFGKYNSEPYPLSVTEFAQWSVFLQHSVEKRTKPTGSESSISRNAEQHPNQHVGLHIVCKVSQKPPYSFFAQQGMQLQFGERSRNHPRCYHEKELQHDEDYRQ